MKTDLIGTTVQERNPYQWNPDDPKFIFGKIRAITSDLKWALIDWGNGKIEKCKMRGIVLKQDSNLKKEEGR